MIRDLENERGDVVMVTAVLILSIALSVGGSLLVNQGQKAGKEEDMLHVASVEDSMNRIRGSMGALLGSEDTRSSLSNRLELGTTGNPYLAIGRSSGSLSYEPAPSAFSMAFTIREGASISPVDSISGMLEFRSTNYYYHDQMLMLQAGAVVLAENGGFSMLSAPAFEFIKDDSGRTLRMDVYGMTGSFWSVAGIDDVSMVVSMKSFSSFEHALLPGQSFVLEVNGIGEQAWRDHFSTSLAAAGLAEGVHYTMTEPSEWDDPGQCLTLSITGINALDMNMGEMEVVI